eukprot:4960386-Alexandrium_andersonii.AAC.1
MKASDLSVAMEQTEPAEMNMRDLKAQIAAHVAEAEHRPEVRALDLTDDTVREGTDSNEGD